MDSAVSASVEPLAAPPVQVQPVPTNPLYDDAIRNIQSVSPELKIGEINLGLERKISPSIYFPITHEEYGVLHKVLDVHGKSHLVCWIYKMLEWVAEASGPNEISFKNFQNSSGINSYTEKRFGELNDRLQEVGCTKYTYDDLALRKVMLEENVIMVEGNKKTWKRYFKSRFDDNSPTIKKVLKAGKGIEKDTPFNCKGSRRFKIVDKYELQWNSEKTTQFNKIKKEDIYKKGHIKGMDKMVEAKMWFYGTFLPLCFKEKLNKEQKQILENTIKTYKSSHGRRERRRRLVSPDRLLRELARASTQ